MSSTGLNFSQGDWQLIHRVLNEYLRDALATGRSIETDWIEGILHAIQEAGVR